MVRLGGLIYRLFAERGAPRRGRVVLRSLLSVLALTLLVLAFVLVSKPTDQTALRSEPVVIALPDSFPPYVIRNPDDSHSGSRPEIWARWSEVTGTPIDLRFMPPDAIERALMSGAVDAADMVPRVVRTESAFRYSAPFGHFESRLFYRQTLTGITGPSTVHDRPVGVIAGSRCEQVLAAEGIAEVRVYTIVEAMIAAATVDQIDVFCHQDAPARYMLVTQGMASQFRESPPLFTSENYWAVRTGDDALFEVIQAGFDLMDPDEIAQIEERWLGAEVARVFGLGVDQVIEVLVILGALVLTSALTVLVLRMRLGRALRAQALVERALRDRIRQTRSLHDVFVASEDLGQPIESVLSKIAEAVRAGVRFPADARVRIDLLGATHDEIGDVRPVAELVSTIKVGAEDTGCITLAYVRDVPLVDGAAFLPEEAAMLDLIASRLGGKATGQATQERLLRSEERFRELFEQSALPTLLYSNHKFLNANLAAARLLGYDSPADLLSRTFDDIFPATQPDGRPTIEQIAENSRKLAAEGNVRCEMEHLRADGEPVLLEVLLSKGYENGKPVTFVVWNDISIRRKAEQALSAYQRTLEAQVALRTEELSNLYDEVRAILSTAGSGIALVRDSKIVSGNPALGRMLLATPDQLQGKPTRHLFRDVAVSQRVADQAREAMRDGGTQIAEEELVRFDGSVFWARLRTTRVDPADPSRGTVLVIDDISHDRAIRRQLAEAREIAEQAVRLKSDFLAQMSHEIRAPINSILGFTELLLNTPLTEPQTDFLRKVQTSGRHLLMIINDILDLSKAEAGKMRIETTAFDLSSVVRSATDTIMQGAADKDIEILVDIAPDVPARVMGDPLRITQILINYLSNAVKFTAAGEIRLDVLRSTDASGEAMLRFTVTDTGIGMTDEQLDRLFQNFSQADESTARLYGGTGLGLAICRHLATLMDGEVGAESQVGGGSTFWFTLPLRAAADAERTATAFPALHGRRALVVDDNERAAHQIARHLTEAGLSVEILTGGESAIEAVTAAQARGEPFDVALLDRKMPGLTGLETVRRLRQAVGADLPRFVLMTKRGGQEMIDLAASEGFDDLLVKPVHPEILLEKLSALFTCRKAEEKADTPASGTEQDWTGRVALVVDDNPINRELSGAILAKQGFTVETADNGASALEAILRRDFDVVLMDGQMPIMGGVEAARRIRALPTAKGKVPIIGLTGRAEEEHRDAGMSAGMNDYLVKPVSTGDLKAVLDRWVPRNTRT